MVKRLLNSMKTHDHWFAEWWNSILLVVVGVYGLCVPNSFIIQQSFIDGFLQFFPFDVWQWLFIVFGLFQFTALRRESMIGRGVAAFFSSSLLIWGTLNILVYGQWHFSLVAWGVFASINLYALYRIAKGIEKYHELL
ncbi:hypothetical protein [Commensalibacter nepenthis]|uniref:Uncharacterized protein n=1 Tax=Commensalibacter nepenthis TaxID=3043872 RepID=A0ABT6Q871_9PROT|nr:hypothetical protein [Commensalibacter sp. TBRC 10068]MDI2113097.1 hypothetical protein [Commensalibacter sp. TBRC 10068]